MNPEIEFSVMRSSAVGITKLLERFEAEQHVHVRLHLLDWDTAWSDLIKVALYSDGPDVSEVGTTWLGDLVAMNALYAFDERDLERLGHSWSFLPSAWHSTHLAGESEVWAIPWVAGARLIIYRKKILNDAGLEPGTAFRDASHFEETLCELQKRNVAVPWTVPTGLTHTTLHNLASWVWGAGGDFISPDGKRTLFTQPAARAGLKAYFTLGRYLAPSVRNLNGLEPDQQFIENADTALTMSGAWLFSSASAELKPQLDVSLPPGPSFVGGSHLIIWKHSTKYEAARTLVQFLTQPEIQVKHSLNVGLLPALVNALASPPFSTDVRWQIAAHGVRTGRSFAVTRAWGLMEDRLTTEFAAIWHDVLNHPDLDLDAAISSRLEPLARRLDLVLGQS